MRGALSALGVDSYPGVLSPHRGPQPDQLQDAFPMGYQ